MASGHQELVAPSPWGPVAGGRAQGTPSLESRVEGLWHGSAARQGHRLPPVQPTCGVPLRSGTQPAWEHLGPSETEELVELQEGHGGNTCRDLFGGLSPDLSEDSSITSTSPHEQSSVHQEVDAEPQGLPSASSSTAETGNCSELLSPARLEEQSSVSGNSQSWGTSLKELEEKWEQEELLDTEAAGGQDSEPQSACLAPLEEIEVEAEASALAGDPRDERHSKLSLTSEPQETSGFSASLLSEGPCEESRICQPAKHTALHKQPCMGTDALLHLMRKKREDLEKLEEDKMYAEVFGDISSMGNEECPRTSSCVLGDPSNASLEAVAEPWVLQNSCSMSKDATGETQNYPELVSPDLLADFCSDSEDSPSLETLLNELLAKLEEEDLTGGRENEPESPLSLPPRDEEDEPLPSPPDSEPCDEEDSEPLPVALSEEAKVLVCALPGDLVEEGDPARVDTGHAQAGPAQEKPSGAGPLVGARPVPAQPMARSVPASPAGSAAVPQPPAPRRWRSILKMAQRALSRVFSFSCLRGQPEE